MVKDITITIGRGLSSHCYALKYDVNGKSLMMSFSLSLIGSAFGENSVN